MTTRFTLSQIKELKASGKIADFKAHEPKKEAGGRKVAKHYPKRSKEKDFIGWNLLIWCQERGLVHEEEYRFDEKRRWRFDWAIPALKLACEYNGVFSEKSRHLTAVGHTGDLNKLNAAQAQGWKVIQMTPLNYTDLITELNKHV